jgi:hypothetical protein
MEVISLPLTSWEEDWMGSAMVNA